MILSVGDRVNTKRGTQFRIRVTLRLREYLMRGYIVHENRMRQLGQVIKLVGVPLTDWMPGRCWMSLSITTTGCPCWMTMTINASRGRQVG